MPESNRKPALPLRNRARDLPARLLTWAGGAALFCAWLAAPAGRTQQFPTPGNPNFPASTSPRTPSMGQPAEDGMDAGMRARMEAVRLRAMGDERHKRMVADTARLLQLATELKADVDKTDKNEMSLEVIRKAAEIEKLAHDVKDRMKG